MSRWPWRGGRRRAAEQIEQEIAAICPELDPGLACCLWVAGARALAGKGRVTAGAFVDVRSDGLVRGWGVNATPLALGRGQVTDVLMLEVDKEVGPEGNYSGHVWLEVGDTVVDVMTGFTGSLAVVGRERIYPWGQRAYVVVPELTAAVHHRWRLQMYAVAAFVAEQRP